MSVERLAILGGSPAFADPVPLYQPADPRSERLSTRIAETLSSGILTKGPALSAFEAALAAFTGVPHAVATSSGLSALTIVLQALRLEGEVIVPAFVFPPVAQAILSAGLTPRPADIDPDSWNVDPAVAEATIGPRTCAIVAVHTSGFPAPAPALESLAARRRVSLIFDAAHALGARIGDRRVGTFGVAEVFSFTPSKVLSCGEGGAVTTADSRLAAEIEAGRNYGRSRSGDWTGRGLSARMPEISALVAREALAVLDEEIDRRASVAAAYRKALADVPGVRFQAPLRGTFPVYRDVSLCIDPVEFGIGRDAVRAVLAAEGVETGAYFAPALPDLPLARRFATRESPASAGAGPSFPVARSVASRVMNLPIGRNTTSHTAEEISAVIRLAHAESSRLAARFQTISAPRLPARGSD
jgi:dTDP-4-amino-4,6-dideoxygalactose transaminase